MKIIRKAAVILSHLTLVLSLCFLIFSALDWYNPQMAFRTNSVSSWLLVTFCIAALLSSAGNILLSNQKPPKSSEENGSGDTL